MKPKNKLKALLCLVGLMSFTACGKTASSDSQKFNGGIHITNPLNQGGQTQAYTPAEYPAQYKELYSPYGFQLNYPNNLQPRTRVLSSSVLELQTPEAIQKMRVEVLLPNEGLQELDQFNEIEQNYPIKLEARSDISFPVFEAIERTQNSIVGHQLIYTPNRRILLVITNATSEEEIAELMSYSRKMQFDLDPPKIRYSRFETRKAQDDAIETYIRFDIPNEKSSAPIWARIKLESKDQDLVHTFIRRIQLKKVQNRFEAKWQEPEFDHWKISEIDLEDRANNESQYLTFDGFPFYWSISFNCNETEETKEPDRTNIPVLEWSAN